MRRIVLGCALLALSMAAAVAVLAAERSGPSNSSSSSRAKSGASCDPSAGAAACEAPKGKLTGRFDAVQSGVCRFACATRLKYDPKDVMAQPGAKSGQLTQCPVSGVVFAVDQARPRVRYGGNEYVTCCDRCATKLRQTPRHYLKA